MEGASSGEIHGVTGRREASAASGRQEFDLRVPADLRTVSRVRRSLEELGLPPTLLGDAKLLASELITNSIRHAGLGPEDQVRIRAAWSGTKLRVDVFDRGGRFGPAPIAGSIRPLPGAESGWGLYLVDRVASRWGPRAGRYWFELELEPDAEG
jgi:anti-sigma regulatory factor (Ser/Thr protein kinase)